MVWAWQAGLSAQGLGVDRLSFGPVAVHDHVTFDLHIPILNDPYPHETREGYAFDGVDLEGAMAWHWGTSPLFTEVRVTPASRAHLAFDQDTDFEPTTNFTHGNQGPARSRTVAVEQRWGLVRSPRLGAFGFQFDWERQWTRYHQVTTYDLNSNPALPSNVYTRLISERAIVYDLRMGMGWTGTRTLGNWQASLTAGVTPVERIWLANYVPVVKVVTSEPALGGTLGLALARRVGRWRFELAGDGERSRSLSSQMRFTRETYELQVLLTPPW